MKIVKLLGILLIAAFGFCICGCSKENDGPSGPAKMEIQLSESSLDETCTGGHLLLDLHYTILPADSAFIPLEFYSDNPSVAEVCRIDTENHKDTRTFSIGIWLNAIRPGTATITIGTPDKSVQAHCVITVKDPELRDDDDIAEFLDPEFVSYLNNLGYDANGCLRYGIAKAITEIPSDGNLNIYDFSSLRFFKSLKKLGNPENKNDDRSAYFNGDCDFSYIPNIKSISLSLREEHKVLNLSTAQSLTSLKVRGSTHDLDITGCRNLEWLRIYGVSYYAESAGNVTHRIKVIGLEQAIKLKHLFMQTFDYDSLDFSKNKSLEYVHLQDGACRFIKLEGASQLKTLVLSEATAMNCIDITDTQIGLIIDPNSGFMPLDIMRNQNPEKEFIIYVTPEQYNAYISKKIGWHEIFEYNYDYDLYQAGERMRIVVVDN